MLKIGKPSERNCSTFDTTAKILRELKKPTGIKSRDPVMAVAIKYHEDTYFENRKRRPQERGRKKRRKGKWNPIDRLWNSANSKGCSSGHLLEQD